ncbi:MAG: hypothetical protein J7K53_11315 [Bacteroidales bacterium]|nr:hypothetical protein [Bacteroidales bacterium]
MKSNTKYSKGVLDDIMLDAMYGFSLSEIASRLNINYDEFLADYNNIDMPIKQFYEYGRIKGKTETDNIFFNLAKNGSATAKQIYDNKMLDADLSNAFKKIFDA